MTIANTLKTAVACAFFGTAVVAAAVSGATAQPKFDRKLAGVLADKAADALGDLRLGETADTAAVPVASRTFLGRTATDAIETGSIRSYAPRIDPTTTDAVEPTRWLVPHTDIRVVYAG